MCSSRVPVEGPLQKESFDVSHAVGFCRRTILKENLVTDFIVFFYAPVLNSLLPNDVTATILNEQHNLFAALICSKWIT